MTIASPSLGFGQSVISGAFTPIARQGGAAAEELFCGSITDNSDRRDREMAVEYLGREFDAVQIAVALARHRDSANALVRTAWAQASTPCWDVALWAAPRSPDFRVPTREP